MECAYVIGNYKLQHFRLECCESLINHSASTDNYSDNSINQSKLKEKT